MEEFLTKNISIVELDNKNRKIYHDIFFGNAFQIQFASSLIEATEYLVKKELDIIFLDIELIKLVESIF